MYSTYRTAPGTSTRAILLTTQPYLRGLKIKYAVTRMVTELINVYFIIVSKLYNRIKQVFAKILT